LEEQLIIEIDRMPREGLRLERDLDFFTPDLVEESAVFLEPTHVEVFVRLVGDEVYVQGELSTRLSLVCSRCLAPFEFPVRSRFDLVYLPEDLAPAGEGLGDDDIDRMFYRERRLDLRELVLEQLNLTFPAKPLCSPACEGLCAVCGELIRDGRCSCLVKETGPRFEKLKILVRDKT
jgi:uncharacterized protein